MGMEGISIITYSKHNNSRAPWCRRVPPAPCPCSVISVLKTRLTIFDQTQHWKAGFAAGARHGHVRNGGSDTKRMAAWDTNIMSPPPDAVFWPLIGMRRI